MLTVIIWLLTAVLVIDCLFLILLVLVQLPKKEAGAGMAFGGAATDALFGAGSGTALTQITKYAAAIFFVGTLTLTVLHAHDKKDASSEVQELLKKETAAPTAPATTPQGAAPTSVITPAPAPAPVVTPAPSATNN